MILALARHAVSHDLDIEYSIIGYSDQDAATKAAGVNVTGAYASEDDPRLIKAPNKLSSDIAELDIDELWSLLDPSE